MKKKVGIFKFSWLIYSIIGISIFVFGITYGYIVGLENEYPVEISADNPTPGEGSVPAAEDQFIVKYKESTSDSQEEKIEKQTDTTTKEEIVKIDTEILTVPNDKNSHKMVSEFRADSADKIDYVELDQIMEPEITPNDPGYAQQWALSKIQAPGAWDINQGSSEITIAILDTGISADHPDLKNKLTTGWNVVDNNADLTDLHGHGTLMAGIAAAQTNNLIGMSGVAINSKIMMVRICNNAEGWAYSSSIAKGIIYAADHGAKVISISFGGSSPSVTIQNAINYAYAKGVFITASAGNNGDTNLNYPAANLNVVSVGATSSNDQKASWSNYGSWIDLTSPGVSIYSTNHDNSYSFVSGTSPATPHVAGVAALLLSINNNLTPTQIESYLTQYSDDLGAAGKDDIFGFGRLNANKPLAVLSGTPHPPVSTVGSISGIIKNTSNAPVVGANISVMQNGSLRGTAVSSASGEYSIDNLPADNYYISVSASGYESAQKSGVIVRAGATTENQNFTLNKIISNGSVSGKVINYRGVKMVGTLVTLKLVSSPIPGVRPFTKTTKTVKNGKYSFKNLPKGIYYIRISTRLQYASQEFKVYNGGNTVVNLKLSKPSVSKWLKNK